MNNQFGFCEDWGKEISINSISDSSTELSELVIPEMIDGQVVTGLSYWNYDGLQYINKLVLPKTVEHINFGLYDVGKGICYQAFEIDCKNKAFTSDGAALFDQKRKKLIYFNNTEISEYKIPDGVEYVENFGKVAQMSLKRLIVPDSVRYFVPPSFWGCKDLQEVVINSRIGFGKYGLGAFESTPWFYETYSNKEFYCEDVDGGCYIRAIFPRGSDIHIPREIDGKFVIGICIEGMKNIETLYIPDTLEEIQILGDESAYETYPIINNFVVDSANNFFKTDGTALFNGDMTELIYMANSVLESYVVPEGIETIGLHAIGTMENLQSITFPRTLRHINASFRECSQLVRISGGENVIDVEHGDRCALDCPWLDVGKKFVRSSSIGRVLLLSGKTIYGDYFIPDGIEVVESYAFGRLRSLYGVERLELPNTIRFIKPYAFHDNNYIKEIIIPESVEIIDKYAFYGCKNLSRVVIRSNKTSINEAAFEGCEKLEFPYANMSNNPHEFIDGKNV
ncbi:MAG: leucine-rich repeat domain-containing protein [Lachnospiraceae bacterium]|nr:leucine-rich repeat domain-containing protein [Lachnospiraceae bacterium]